MDGKKKEFMIWCGYISFVVIGVLIFITISLVAGMKSTESSQTVEPFKNSILTKSILKNNSKTEKFINTVARTFGNK